MIWQLSVFHRHSGALVAFQCSNTRILGQTHCFTWFVPIDSFSIWLLVAFQALPFQRWNLFWKHILTWQYKSLILDAFDFFCENEKKEGIVGSGPQSKFQAQNLLFIFLLLCEVACTKQKLWYLKNALIFMNGKFQFSRWKCLR